MILFCNTAFAYEARYFKKFVGSEVRITYQINQYRNGEIVIYVTDVDILNGVIIGRSNQGDTYIESDKVILIQKKDDTWQAVLNHE